MTDTFPRTSLNFSDPGFLADPYPEYARLRAAGPVVFHDPTAEYLVTGWRDCARVLGNPETYMTAPEPFVRLFGGMTMEAMERDRHDPVRGIWAPAFQRKSLEAHRAMITEIVDSRLLPFVERVRAGETVDAVGELTRHIPTLVIAQMMGIPDEDHARFSRWSDLMGGITQGAHDTSPHAQAMIDAGLQATADLNAYILDQVRRRGAAGRDDLLGQMVDSPVGRTQMDESEIVASNTQLVFAGNETTAKLMAHVILALHLFPDQRRLVLDDRSLIPRAIEEIHRYFTIAHVNWRVVRGGGASIGGHDLADGAVIRCLIGAANRDPGRWENPDVLDVLRPTKGHLGFGFGLHNCLGLNLARLEVQVLLERLLDLLPQWRVTDVRWADKWTLRGPATVLVAAGD